MHAHSWHGCSVMMRRVPRGRRLAIVGGIAAILVLAGAGVAVTAGRGASSPAGSSDGAYYAEITATVDDLDGPRARIDGISPGAHVTHVRVWFADARHWRTEYETVEPVIEADTLVNVADGTQIWSYDESTRSYARYPLPDAAGGSWPLIGSSALIGPAPGSSIDELAAEIRANGFTAIVGELLLEHGHATPQLAEFGALRARQLAGSPLAPVHPVLLHPAAQRFPVQPEITGCLVDRHSRAHQRDRVMAKFRRVLRRTSHSGTLPSLGQWPSLGCPSNRGKVTWRAGPSDGHSRY